MKQKLAKLLEKKKELSFDLKKDKLVNLFNAFFDGRVNSNCEKVDYLIMQTEINALRGQVEHFANDIGVSISPEHSANNPYNNKFNDSFGTVSFDEKYEKISNLYSCFISRIDQSNLDERDFFALSSELRRIHITLSDLSLLVGMHTPSSKNKAS